MSDESIFAVSVSAVAVVWLAVMWRRGPNVATGVAAFVAALMPIWGKIQLWGLPVDCRTATAGVALLWICLDRRGRVTSPLVLLDGLVAALIVWHVVSDTNAQGFSPAVAVRAYGEWALPYLMGRLAIRRPEHAQTLSVWGAGVLAVLGLLAACEPLLGFNPYDAIFGPPKDSLFPRDILRYGRRRAMGPTEHPIFLGLILLTLLPWAASLWGRRGKFRAWSAVCTLLGLLGVASTLSRAPVMAVGIAAVVLLAVRFRWLRWPVGIAAVAAAVLIGVFPTKTAMALSRLTGEDRQRTDVEIRGQRYEVSGTLFRVQLVRHYWPAFEEAGPLGYGTRRAKGFPPDVPHLGDNERTKYILRAVDNSYLLLGLRFGWVGSGLFAVLLFAGVWTGLRLADVRMWFGVPPALAAAVAAVIPTLLTVYLAYDYAFELLTAVGFIAAIASIERGERLGRSVA